MKTNQIFNFNRFGRYAKSTFSTTYKQTMWVWGTIITSSFIISLIAMAPTNSQWNHGVWIPVFTMIYFTGGIILAGFSFPQFRSKEKTLMTLMLPVTPFERLMYEFIEKVVGFILLFPLFFYLSSTLAVSFRNSMGSSAVVTYNGMPAFPFKGISYGQLVTQSDGFFWAFLALSVFVFIVSFTGAATFKKFPLIKTIVFVGSVLAVTAGYFVLIFEKFHLNHPWISTIDNHGSKEQGIALLITLAAFASLITLAYAYFKLKEKEAQ